MPAANSVTALPGLKEGFIKIPFRESLGLDFRVASPEVYFSEEHSLIMGEVVAKQSERA